MRCNLRNGVTPCLSKLCQSLSFETVSVLVFCGKRQEPTQLLNADFCPPSKWLIDPIQQSFPLRCPGFKIKRAIQQFGVAQNDR